MIHFHHLRLRLGCGPGNSLSLCLYIFNFTIYKHMCNMKKVDLWAGGYHMPGPSCLGVLSGDPGTCWRVVQPDQMVGWSW